MSEETNSAPALPSERQTKEPKARKASGKPRPKAEEKKAQEKTKGLKPDVKSERDTNAENGKQQEAKRPNRRRRGKGKAQGKDAEKQGADEAPAMQMGEPKEKAPAQASPNAQRPELTPRRKLDPDKVAKNAWKIFLAEVSEEGVSLVGDNDARELARRCFRLAEIFLEEEDRRS